MREPLSLPVPDPPGAAALRRALLKWYGSAHRPLPWRQSRDPYAVLVSEFMLQQTRAAAVIPYYRSFLERFPTLESLAAASEEEVRAVWSGLGYYNRARNLRETARRILRDHGGRLPSDPADLRRLPGVGDYTAAALASIVHDAPRAVVDGNVVRVLSRLLGLDASVSRLPVRRALQDLADRLLDPRRPGRWNQAMMELGATVRVPTTAPFGGTFALVDMDGKVFEDKFGHTAFARAGFEKVKSNIRAVKCSIGEESIP